MMSFLERFRLLVSTGPGFRVCTINDDPIDRQIGFDRSRNHFQITNSSIEQVTVDLASITWRVDKLRRWWLETSCLH